MTQCCTEACFLYLTLTNIFSLPYSANVPSLAFTVTVQHTVGPIPTVSEFSTITPPTCTLHAANRTLRNTRSFLEPDYTRHTWLATQLKGQGEIQNHSGQSAVNATPTAACSRSATGICYYRHSEKSHNLTIAWMSSIAYRLDLHKHNVTQVDFLPLNVAMSFNVLPQGRNLSYVSDRETYLPESLYIRSGIIYRTALLDKTVTSHRVYTSVLSITADQWHILKEGQILALTGSALQSKGGTS